VTVFDNTGGKATVGLGVRPKQVDEAIRRLRAKRYKVDRRRHTTKPDDDEDWWDKWDDRTERLLDFFDDDSISPNDPRFYELS
jgi:hypothetical protein